MNTVIFPGQGSQYCGIGKDLYDNFSQVKKIFNDIDDILDKKISYICFWEEKKLHDLYTRQLAIIATSLATYELFKQKGIGINICSGLNLGEYTALYPVEVLTLKGLIRLVEKRAEASLQTAQQYLLKLLTVIGLQKDSIGNLPISEEIYIININALCQIVIAVKVKK
jgi:[acyl-carrier-protein] S-malonyltransferase